MDPTSNKSSVLTTLKDVLASIVGSTACVYTGQPFDTVKVRMQVQPGEFTSAIHCFSKTFKGEGITALWRGSLPALTGALSENAVAFGVNGALNRFIFPSNNTKDKKQSGVWHYLHPFVNGAITGTFTAVVLCPCDVMKCRAQLSRLHGKETSLTKLVMTTLRSQGLSGFYTGFSAQLIRDIPFYASFFGVYTVSCDLLKSYTSWTDTTVYFMSGGFAGQVAWLVSIAPDTIKTRIQTSLLPLSFIATGKDIVTTRGVGGLFAGISVAIIRAFPANAALFVGYELSREFMGE